VGGGPTGTECLGEVQRKYGNSKKYGLINSSDYLLDGFPRRAREKAINHFRGNNTMVYTGQRFDPNSELAQEYDFILM
jgi:NADH dehydrogenase FAD-containing subunit